MNKSRRGLLLEASGFLDRASGIISNALRQESYAMDNIPENLQETERFSKMEDSVDAMEDAIQSIRDAQKSLEEAMS